MNLSSACRMLGLGVAALIITACNQNYEGTMDVNEALSLKVGRNTETLQPGFYNIKAGLKEGDKLTLSIDLPGRNNDLKLKIKVPNGKDFHPGMGDFELLAREIGQDYDLAGNLSVHVTRGEEQYRTESCVSHHNGRMICYRDRHGNRYCHRESHPVYGWREVRYYMVTTSYDLDFAFQHPGTGMAAAEGSAHDRQTEIRYTYQGFCRY